MINVFETKLCKKCSAEKSRTSFIKTTSGLKHWCFDCRKPHKRAEYLKNSAQYKQNSQARYRLIVNNPELRKRDLEQRRAWKKRNSKKMLANTRSRQLKLKQRVPKWANLQKIKEIYINCPKGYHVDHIIPLNGKIVSGLHVESNLQYLPAEENVKKGNKYAA